MEKLMKDKDHEMSEVLTAQYEKYLKRREDMRKSSQQNQQSRGGGFDGPQGAVASQEVVGLLIKHTSNQ
jgi:hypothetical protein